MCINIISTGRAVGLFFLISLYLNIQTVWVCHLMAGISWCSSSLTILWPLHSARQHDQSSTAQGVPVTLPTPLLRGRPPPAGDHLNPCQSPKLCSTAGDAECCPGRSLWAAAPPHRWAAPISRRGSTCSRPARQAVVARSEAERSGGAGRG